MTMKWVFDLHEEDTYWCTADIGWVTGHSYIVYGPLSAGATTRDVRRRAGFPAARPLLAHHREVPRQHLLHVAHRDPRLRPAGRPVAERARYVEPAAAGLGGRADQSGGVGVVLQGDRQGALPDRGYLVADRDRRHHDRADARRGAAEARVRHAAAAGSHGRRGGSAGQAGGGESRRLPDHPAAVAQHGAHAVGRSGALQAAVLGAHRRAST